MRKPGVEGKPHSFQTVMLNEKTNCSVSIEVEERGAELLDDREGEGSCQVFLTVKYCLP